MADRSWTSIAKYEYMYEADMAEATLKSADIPVIVKGREAGIWGTEFAGPTRQGLSIWVPNDAVESAMELLGDDASGEAD